MALNRRRFQEWVERRMLSAGEVPARFQLEHVSKAGPCSLVCKLEPISDAAGADDIAQIVAEQVHQEAIDHIEGWPGRQQYVVRAYTETDREVGEFAFFQIANHITHTQASRSMVELTPEQDAMAAGHLPNAEQLGHPTAMVANQQMRHNEGLVRYMTEMSAMSRERDASIIRSLQASNDRHEDRNMQMMQLFETMCSKQLERELATKTYEDDRDRKERLMENLNKWVLPEIAKRVGVALPASDKSSGEDSATMVADIRDIFLSLPDEMQNAFVAELEESKRDRLMSIFERAGTSASDTKH